MLTVRHLGTLAFVIFMLFVAYRILTPRRDELQRLESPDGSRSARLSRHYLYDKQPSYRIHYRETEKRLWQPLYYLPAYTNVPPEAAKPLIAWTADSTRLDFLMNGTSIWHHVFEEE